MKRTITLITVPAVAAAIFLSGCGETAAPAAKETASAPAKVEKKTATEPVKTTAVKKEEVKPALPAATPEEKVANEDAVAIYKAKCASCHGAHGELKALGASKKIGDMSEEEIKTALEGYKAGTYGGKMKNVMAPQASGLSESEIDALSAYIASLRD